MTTTSGNPVSKNTNNNTTAPFRVVIVRRGSRDSRVDYTDRAKARAYLRKQARDGFKLFYVRPLYTTCGTPCIYAVLRRLKPVPHTPGYQCTDYGFAWDPIKGDGPRLMSAYKNQGGCQIASDLIPISKPTPVKYGVRSIKDGVVLEWETFATIEDARGYAEDDIDEGATESVIIAVNRDGSLGDVVETIRPEPTIDYSPSATVSVDAAIQSAPVQTTNTSATMGPIDHDEIRAIMDARAVWIEMANGTEWMIGLWNWQCEHFKTGVFSRAYDMETITATSKGLFLGVGRDHPILIKWSDMARVDVIPMTFKGVN